uniref:ASCH domain-containing protein n=1 Tax=Streptomyces sp. NBC_00003 TaxID=2903608 RepID=A0AAU2VBX6_9ACTN
MTDQQPLPEFPLAFPGPLRDQLVSAVLSGSKTSTTGLLADYEYAGDPLPYVGERSRIIDSAGEAVAVIEVTDVRVLPLAEVDLQHVIDEGEGDESVAGWRANHEKFWRSPEMLETLGDPSFRVTDETLVIATRFRLVERVASLSAP